MPIWTPEVAPVVQTPTILDPSDPALGTSYDDGVERARRVRLKKKKPAGVGDTPPTSAAATPEALTAEDLSMLREIGAPPTVSPGDLENYRRMRRGPQSTILGG